MPDKDPKPAVKAEAPAEPRKLDETVAGGRYLVGGQLVDAAGKPVKD